jgi:hypothetical protein
MTERKAARGVYGPVSLDFRGTDSGTMSLTVTLERTIQFKPSKPLDTLKSSSINAKTEALSVNIQGHRKKA